LASWMRLYIAPVHRSHRAQPHEAVAASRRVGSTRHVGLLPSPFRRANSSSSPRDGGGTKPYLAAAERKGEGRRRADWGLIGGRGRQAAGVSSSQTPRLRRAPPLLCVRPPACSSPSLRRSAVSPLDRPGGLESRWSGENPRPERTPARIGLVCSRLVFPVVGGK
jgi:hypothetical protein